MKKTILIYILMIFLYSCDRNDALDCIQKRGDIVEETYELGAFTKIRVNRGVELMLQHGEGQNVRVKTGENLLSDIVVEVIEGQLIISDLNHCNFVRDDNITKAYVTSPDIEEIRCSTEYPIRSIGTLTYPNLTIFAENYQKPDVYSVGDFNLTVDCEVLNVYSNGVSLFDIDGNARNLFVGFYSGVGRFEGKSLVADDVQIYHNGQNDILVNPQESLRAEIINTGNILSYNRPDSIDVTSIYHGDLIFIND